MRHGRVMSRPDPIRLLFLAFGYSIHAHRRVRVFSEDPDFRVHLVSNHPYEIDNVPVTVLSGPAGLVRARNHLPQYARAVARLLGENGVGQVSNELFQEMVTQQFAYRQLLRAVRQFRPDALFLQTLLYPSYLACLLPQEIPKFITFWNGDLIWWAQQNQILKTCKRQIVERGIQAAAAVTVNSATARSAAAEYGIAPERVHLIRYPGVDLEHFTPGGKQPARERLGLGDGPVVLCPRGLGGYLNTDVLMEAACAVARLEPNVTFLFISGVGREKWDEFMQIPRAMGLESHFRHDGEVAWEDMPNYYRAADVMVSPSSNDSQPNCMLEAMACGASLVMGDIPSIREWVSDGRNGRLVPPRDAGALAAALVATLRDGPGQKRMAALNRTLVEDRVDSRTQCAMVRDMVRETLQRV
ncbi:glycosyltransferase family 4 protein [Oceanidesulfovibrio marinus]|uniref:Glycosyltransferase family 4 protein n=2 Tax=Oceanidesulfovibrio marinus TaxID=370038 RepID=A0ABX6NAK5_9BACT|nr:glycosyltransferase family 4 protein [Oceanidesulfovibrio marinus]